MDSEESFLKEEKWKFAMSKMRHEASETTVVDKTEDDRKVIA